MINIALIILACTAPPLPHKDTAVRRLRAYHRNPKLEYCYKWHPDVSIRKDRRFVYETILLLEGDQ